MDSDALLRKVKRHAPVLKFAQGEKFFPMNVNDYVPKCSLHTWVGGNDIVMQVPPGQLTIDDLPRWLGHVHFLVYADHETYVDLIESQALMAESVEELIDRGALAIRQLARYVTKGNLPEHVLQRAQNNYGGIEQNPPLYYYRVILNEQTKFNYDFIQYWFFYAYNDWAGSHDGVNDHEGDWEVTQLAFKNLEDDEPYSVAYSAHDGNYRRAWSAIQDTSEGLHPVIYVGGGSHACFPDMNVGSFNYLVSQTFKKPLKFLSHVEEYLNTGAERWIPGDVVIGSPEGVPWAEPVNLDGLDWVGKFRGQWGARYLIEEPGRRQKRRRPGGAPCGPMYELSGFTRQSWDDPVGWHRI
jgi:hypothetical protein